MFMNSIPSIVIDSTNALTELCYMGKLARTDKTPYNEHGHRHPYTAVYSLLFGSLRYRQCKFAEIGVAGGASVVLWNNYFKNALFYFFDRDTDFLNNASNYVPKEKNTFTEMDVSSASSIVKGLQATAGELDVLLDDSTHTREDQILIIKEGLPFIKSGGMIIIEDVYRNASEEYYLNELKDVLDQFSQAFFITTDHTLRYSPGWDNDKLLVLIKK